MSYTTTEARDEMKWLRTCGNHAFSYEDIIWGLRYPLPFPKSTGAWPFKPASQQASNVVEFLRAQTHCKDLGDGWMG